MSTALRLALAVVSVSLLVTLAVIACGRPGQAASEPGQRPAATLHGPSAAMVQDPNPRPAALHVPTDRGRLATSEPPLAGAAPAGGQPAVDTAAESSPPPSDPATLSPERPSASASGTGPPAPMPHLPPEPPGTNKGNAEEGPVTLALWQSADQPTSPEQPQGTGTEKVDLNVVNKDINYVLQLLSVQTRRNILTSEGVKGPISVTLFDTDPEEALEMILKMKGYVARTEGNYTLVYTREELDRLEQTGGKWDILIYKPMYISAQDLKEIVTEHTSDQAMISTSAANEIGIAADSDKAGGDSLAVDDVIVIQDYESVLRRIEKIIQQVDVPPPQVLIEAVLLSVKLDDEHRMGVNFAMLADADSNLFEAGIGATLNASAGFKPATLIDNAGKMRGSFADSTHGLKYGVVRGNLTAFVHLLETIGNTTIVASPKVLALNKQRAEILVGRRIGYRTITTSETAAVEEVQFLDTGTQLRIRPFVLPDGRIRLELHPERSSGQINPDTGAPDEDTTSVTTNLVVVSGTTIVIGGLIQEQQERAVQQIPFLGTLPFVGRLFRDQTVSVTREELIVLVTPRIVTDQELAAQGVAEFQQFKKRRDSLLKALPPHSRVSLARRYYGQARLYYSRGNLAKALEMADRAVQLDPTDQWAVLLRDQLAAAQPPCQQRLVPEPTAQQPDKQPANQQP